MSITTLVVAFLRIWVDFAYAIDVFETFATFVFEEKWYIFFTCNLTINSSDEKSILTSITLPSITVTNLALIDQA